jgi:hypothetical protein
MFAVLGVLAFAVNISRKPKSGTQSTNSTVEEPFSSRNSRRIAFMSPFPNFPAPATDVRVPISSVW